MNVIDILKECESDNGRLFKIDVLERNKDNELLKSVIKCALDPYTQYYIRKIPEYDSGDKEFRNSLEWGIENLDQLSSREVTGNKAIAHLKDILENLTDRDAEVIERIISKDLKCGVNTATVNKVFGKGFIEKYPCMLAGAYNEKNFKHIKYPALVQTKMDGMRANILMFDDGKVEVRSRNGKLLELHSHFDDYTKSLFYKGATLDNLAQFRDCVIDGELCVLSEDGASVLDRKTGNGILNKAVKGTISKEESARVRMFAWDLIPMDDFKNLKSDVPYFDRLEVLGIRLDEAYNASEMGDLIRLVPTIPVETYEESEELFRLALDSGEEGVIVKNGDSPWEDKRSKYQVKMKAELEADLLVTEWNEGTGRIQGLLGAVTCVSEDGKLEVNVGSGFNDEDRKMKPEDIVGKIITVKYNEVIQDKKKDKKSLFLPIFVEIRLDKTKADIL